MEHTHLMKPSNEKQLHSIHMCRENEFKPGDTLVGHLAAVCIGTALVAAQACERTGAAGQIVPTQLANKIMIFGAKLLGHHPDMALGHGWSHMELYSIL